MKKNTIFLIISIIVSIVSTVLILVFDEINSSLGSEIAAVFLIVGVAFISIFSKKIRKEQLLKNNHYQHESQPTQQANIDTTTTCEYCGAKNEKINSKCISCGARLK